LSANRYSELKQIHRGNAGGLRLKWIFPIPYYGLEVTPLEAGGVMYVTGPNRVCALDARSGRDARRRARGDRDGAPVPQPGRTTRTWWRRSGHLVMVPRRRAREAALQILYLWEIGRIEPEEAIDVYFRQHDPEADDKVQAFAATLVHGTTAEVAALDVLIDQHTANWRVARLAVIDRLILRLAAWELQHETDTPAAVVLNEAIELARRFSADEAVGFVNGVLDGIRKALPGAPS
jgi:N utilization substance protein B